MERFARTVLGDIKGEEMGFTYPHEHLHAVPPPCQKDRDLELSSYENSVQELLNFKEVGGRTLVEASTLDYGRDLNILKRMAQETGVHIIATTGFNKHIYYPSWVAEKSMEEIAGMFAENSDEPYAEEIAREIAKRNRKRQYIETTTELKEVIEQVLSFIPEKERKEAVKKSCQRCFQALRIDVNQEFEVLESFLSKLPGILAPGGRAAILTFHSGEDRLVKYYFKDGKKEEIYSDVASDVIRPSAEECQRNPRARSTKMRWAIRDGENPHRM